MGVLSQRWAICGGECWIASEVHERAELLGDGDTWGKQMSPFPFFLAVAWPFYQLAFVDFWPGDLVNFQSGYSLPSAALLFSSPPSQQFCLFRPLPCLHNSQT
jgi:hypothetical protein